MSQRALRTGWLTLMALSLISTVISLWSFPDGWQALAGTAILILAWLKARVILGRYLGLDSAPFWARGFGIALGLFCVLLLGLYLAPLMF
ncbi:cytochrome C oxidase subunit IV family protein [Sedimentitalea nanhaiensis]|uniref:Cytochrome C oxidase subunit IV n=1 Tax=Sedimentitalea nanhaiensis TaxID=999627 RepID=A0A1I6XL09_9RHOB|nr:cytochrome C oxidase subunit IV family protein [Sedimentitalea nanhaiensis]SFT39045.1 Cytochrome C oxidase subunit IV [Sedimentitalea nanhaiensis]